MGQIDYARMQRVGPKQKAALTRAVKSGDYRKLADVCRLAVTEWDAIGAWPDHWSNWQRALDDAALKAGQPIVNIRYL
jgi:Arc/MetJ-type ribon-helix-helix transcriptional regulator